VVNIRGVFERMFLWELGDWVRGDQYNEYTIYYAFQVMMAIPD